MPPHTFYAPIYARFFQVVLSLRFPHQKPAMHLSPPPYVPHAQSISFFSITIQSQYNHNTITINHPVPNLLLPYPTRYHAGTANILSIKTRDKNHSKPGACVKVNTAVTTGLWHREAYEECDVSRLRREKQAAAVHDTDISGQEAHFTVRLTVQIHTHSRDSGRSINTTSQSCHVPYRDANITRMYRK